MKTCGGVAVKLDRSWPRREMEVSGQLHPLPFYPLTHCIGGRVGPRSGLNLTEKTEILPRRESNPGVPGCCPSLHRLSFPGCLRLLIISGSNCGLFHSNLIVTLRSYQHRHCAWRQCRKSVYGFLLRKLTVVTLLWMSLKVKLFQEDVWFRENKMSRGTWSGEYGGRSNAHIIFTKNSFIYCGVWKSGPLWNSNSWAKDLVFSDQWTTADFLQYNLEITVACF
jgi:hypothetical protein